MIHAYVLMTNHVHLLITATSKAGMGNVMQSLGCFAVQYFNDVYHRTGTLWEGRYKATLLNSEDYLLTCRRYIKLNPVRAGMVERPEEYEWSSYRAKVGLERVPWLDTDLCYVALGHERSRRASRYREFVTSAVPDGESALIRDAVQRGQLSGGASFQEAVARRFGRRAPLS